MQVLILDYLRTCHFQNGINVRSNWKSKNRKKTVSKDKFAIIIEVDNVNETFDQLKAKSIEFITEPKDMKAWGIRVAHLRDPEGNLIEIFSNLSKSE